MKKFIRLKTLYGGCTVIVDINGVISMEEESNSIGIPIGTQVLTSNGECLCVCENIFDIVKLINDVNPTKNFIRLKPLYNDGDIVIIDVDNVVCIEEIFSDAGKVKGALLFMTDDIHIQVCEGIDEIVRLMNEENPDNTFIFDKEYVR